MKKLILALMVFAGLLTEAHAGVEMKGFVGPKTVTDGNDAVMRLSKDSATVTLDGHARYQEPTMRQNVYFACNQAGIALPAGLTTAAKNLTIYNPLGSGKNLVLIDVTMGITVVPAAYPGAVFLVANLTPSQAAPATTTAETVRSGLLGGTGGVGLAYNTATLAATPVIIRNLFSVAWVTTGTTTTAVNLKDEIAGAIIIPPGIYVSMGATAAATAQFCATWEEVNQ